MEHFWPVLPFVIPSSEGIPIWWDIFWWAFQVVIMTTILVLLRRWAVREDNKMDQQLEQPAVIPADTDMKM